MDSILSPVCRLLPRVARHRLLEAFPLVLLDIGCSEGIHGVWSRLGPNLVAHGYDPAPNECKRLAAAESRPTVHYHSRYVGLPDSHPFVRGRDEALEARGEDSFFPETSAGQALLRDTPAGIRRNDYGQWSPPARADVLSVDEAAAGEGLRYVDVLKIDVDGVDIEVLHSAESTLRQMQVSCVALEVNFAGHGDPYSNTFSNTDRLLRTHGFSLGNLSVWRYSLACLPAPFKYRALGETVWGAPLIGDAVYFRDPEPPPEDAPVEARQQHAAGVLKLAALCEMFGVPDWAARLLLAEQSRLARLEEPVGPLLDLLVPDPFYPNVGYADYVKLFQNQMQQFFPPGPAGSP